MDQCSDIGRAKTRTVGHERAGYFGRKTVPKVVPGHACLRPSCSDWMHTHDLVTIGNQVNVKVRRVENGFGRNHAKVKPEQTAFLAITDETGVKDFRSTTVRIWIGCPNIGIDHDVTWCLIGPNNGDTGADRANRSRYCPGSESQGIGRLRWKSSFRDRTSFPGGNRTSGKARHQDQNDPTGNGDCPLPVFQSLEQLSAHNIPPSQHQRKVNDTDCQEKGMMC